MLRIEDKVGRPYGRPTSFKCPFYPTFRVFTNSRLIIPAGFGAVGKVRHDCFDLAYLAVLYLEQLADGNGKGLRAAGIISTSPIPGTSTDLMIPA